MEQELIVDDDRSLNASAIESIYKLKESQRKKR